MARKATNKFYWNGNQIGADRAYKAFRDYSPARYEMNGPQLAQCWEDCQTSEDQRDIYLPAYLEVVQTA